MDVSNLEWTARVPQQERSRARFERVLREADRMLAQAGPAGFSIPELAARLGYSRPSIYHLFPTPQSILQALSLSYLQELEACLQAAARNLPTGSWYRGMAWIIDAAVDFFNRHDVAAQLLLSSQVGPESQQAIDLCVRRLGELASTLLESAGLQGERQSVDVASLAVAAGLSGFRLSVQLQGRITDEYAEEAKVLMRRYLEARLQQS